ncbi:hypothetical protein AYR62_15295 [Secundilactobacillus paracollinoides]|uniref:DUF1097 domain-containing protein n=1 Tax=Secundilactobacillus paracollinoides TaxID=240427 RepID=A0A1B2IW22_9LACO|nr:DUF1097 domain-containing protein [Secundilactobacillus paracollinoides]ANZ60409.1 hypothetical protein AYR61_02975 [Secundilactobacillus paracollinoides]ANZ65308.1 hypothetical protein AYR62_15295 [Secundilactobacillus paracollinoides]ANZ66237.1 hypothetical protein AYR63_03180 [Secundilactobacillus paracollinoides]KRL76705.1 hypothetical protein FC17_GL001771 [Secundilactobacillus paracollinoides DSM 15502 = JCM 11969]
MKISKKVWFDAIGVGLFTIVYSLIMSGFSLWMGSAAFIAVSYFFGAGFPKDKIWNILCSFALGIVWGLIAFRLLHVPSISGVIASSVMFGIMTFIVLFLQGTIMKFTLVPAWLIAWGTTMLILSNITIHNWGLFVFQLYACMVLGIFVIGYFSDYFNQIMFRLFPEKNDHEQETDTEETDNMADHKA